MAERVYVALDLETTGLDAKRDAIIEIGAVRFQGNRILDRFVTFVNPHRAIPLRIQQITNIRNSDVVDAPTIDDVLPELLAFVRQDTAALVAHNAAFDLGFLSAAGIAFQRPVLDTFELATILLPGLGSYSLGELCHALTIELTDAHRALDDATATALLFMQLQERARRTTPATLQLIVESAQQSDWALSQLFADALALIEGTPAPVLPHITALTKATADEQTETGVAYTADAMTSPLPSTGAPAMHQRLPAEENPIEHVVAAQLVDQFFAVDGPLAQRLGKIFEVRRGQIDMARQILRAFNEGDHMLLEAGTGIGKSMAYLVPAALWSVHNGRRVVIATNTITLQEQLLEKELPLLCELLDAGGHQPPQVTLLKGRRHYLCLRRFHVWRQSHRLSAAELTFLAKVLIWLPTTVEGEMEEIFLATANERAYWEQICSHPTTCTPDLCDTVVGDHGWAMAQRGRNPQEIAAIPSLDFFFLARRRAEEAHLLIVNHALLIADLVTGGHLLPSYSHLIVDEAHHLDQVATEQLTYRADWQWIFPLLRRLGSDGDLVGAIEAQATTRGQFEVIRSTREVVLDAESLSYQLHEFCDRLRHFAETQRDIRLDAGYAQQIHLDHSRRSQPQWSQIEIEWEQTRGWLSGLVRQLAALLNQLERAQWRQDTQSSALLHTTREQHERLAELATQLNAIILQEGSVDVRHTITWAEVGDSGQGSSRKQSDSRNVVLAAAPLYINEILEKDLTLHQRTAIFTGATLRTGSGFTFIRDRLGLWHASALTVDSPFDYEWSSLLCMPTDMPAPDHTYYQAAVERAIIDAAIATGGKTLALFTSYAQLRATADAIRAELDRADITVLEHGTSSRRRILREYRRLDRAVLLGTRSFWEGVDLPGDELRCLLIAKLPFAVPSDPLVAARCADLENPFGDYMLPDAILRFRQGFGRLIRRESDRGAVVLLDSRLWRKDYGQAFLESLPRCTISRAPLSNLQEEIQHWLNEYV